jgi:hypothetical protein
MGAAKDFAPAARQPRKEQTDESGREWDDDQ